MRLAGTVVAVCAAVALAAMAVAADEFDGLTLNDLRQTLDDAGIAYAESQSRLDLVQLVRQHEAGVAARSAAAAGGSSAAAARGRGHVLRGLVCIG
jgi:hypothetical protein